MSSFQARQGSLKIVDATKVAARGALFVTEARLRSMLKWVWLIISIAIANPVLYLVSIGLGLGSYIDQNAGAAGVDGVSYLTFLAPALLQQLQFKVRWMKVFSLHLKDLNGIRHFSL